MKITKLRVLSGLLFIGVASSSLTQSWGAEVLTGNSELATESRVLSKEEMMDGLLDILKDSFMGPLKEGTFDALEQTMPADEVEDIKKACDYAFAQMEDSVSKIMKKVYMSDASTKMIKALHEFYAQPEMVSFMNRYCMAAVKINDHVRYGITHYKTQADPLPSNKLSKAFKTQREGMKKCFGNLQLTVEKYGRTQISPWNGDITDDAWDDILKGSFKIYATDFARVDYTQSHPQPILNLRGLMKAFTFKDQEVKNICDHALAKMYADTVGDYPEGIVIYSNFMKKYGKKTKALDEKVSHKVETDVMPMLSHKMDEYFELEGS